MATFPTYAKLMHDGHRVAHAPAVLRTEMESGPPKQIKIHSRSMVTHQVQYAINTVANYQSFWTWFKNDIARGAGWFDWPDPIDDTVRTARIVGGVIEEEQPNRTLDVWVLRFKIEHWDG